MQKLYVFVLLVTHLAHTSCMQKERPSKKTDYTEIPLDEFRPTQYHTRNLCTAQEPGWEKLEAISDMPYTSHHQNQPIILAPSNTSPTDITQAQNTLVNQLMQTNRNLKEQLDQTQKALQKQQLMLYTHTSNEKIKNPETLYQKIFDLPGQKINKLIQLIEHMKNTDIPANDMAKYAYNKWVPKKDYATAQAVLACLYIKDYNQKVSNSNECLPHYRDITKRDNIIGNELAYSLGIPSDKNYSVSNGAYDGDSTACNYPAFHRLYTSIRSITIGGPKLENFTNFIDYIYSNNTPPKYKLDDVKATYDTLKNAFHQKAYTVAAEKKDWAISDLCYLIHIIDIGKKLNPAKQECDFISSYIGKTALIGDPYAIMLCHLIQKYNNQRTTKLTPTPAQYKNYVENGIPIFKYALPDSFDSTLFDETKYAFKELSKLIEEVLKLRTSSVENVEECVNQIYPPRK